jgi:hypothetical protein
MKGCWILSMAFFASVEKIMWFLSILLICNPYPNSNDILHRNRKGNHEVYMETRKTLNSQSNSEQRVQYWRHHNIQLQTILQNHNNKNSIVLAQKQTWRPTDQNRRSRH